MAGSVFGIGTPFTSPGIGPYQGIGSYNPVATLPQVAQVLQIVPQQLQQLQQLEWAQRQQLQQIQQLMQVVAYQFQYLTQQLGGQGLPFGVAAPHVLTSPFQTLVSSPALATQPLQVM